MPVPSLADIFFDTIFSPAAFQMVTYFFAILTSPLHRSGPPDGSGALIVCSAAGGHLAQGQVGDFARTGDAAAALSPSRNASRET